MPDMETERQVVVSGVVTSDAARATGTSQTHLQQGLTVTVPADSTVLVLQYADTTAAAAQRRAQAIAQSYAVYRAPQVAILSDATTPRSATRPNYLVNAAAGLALGLLLGVGSALLRDGLDDSVRGPSDLVEEDLPVLATVRLATAEGADDSDQITVLDAPDSPAAEAYRLVRGKVDRAVRDGDRTTTVILVASAARDDGAAQVAANTAVALALAGCKVLLVEGNLRTPRLGALFDVPADVGLGEVLAGKVSLTEAVRTSRVEGLRLLPAGTDVPSAPWELFNERAVEKLLSEVPADVDHVVLQAPPVLGVAETSTMAGHAHLLVLVATTGRTGRRDVRAALGELRDSRARLLGGVLCEGAGRERAPLWSWRGAASAGPNPSTPDGAGRTPESDGDGHQAPAARPEDHDRITHAG
jgi:capsular exopolysaccharide synthesis family protein